MAAFRPQAPFGDVFRVYPFKVAIGRIIQAPPPEGVYQPQGSVSIVKVQQPHQLGGLCVLKQLGVALNPHGATPV
jgi:hypothetical protein